MLMSMQCYAKVSVQVNPSAIGATRLILIYKIVFEKITKKKDTGGLSCWQQ